MPAALRTVTLGHHGEIHVGEKIPSTYMDNLGAVQDTDWARLLEIEVIDALPEPPKRRGRPAKIEDPQPSGDDGDEAGDEGDDDAS